jgi:IMP dehydrogenase
LVSIGVGTQELTRFIELYKAGARTFIIDVAHGASKQVVRQYNIIKEQYKDVFLIVGNFASYSSFEAFKEKVRRPIDGVKLGVGSGAMCSTRIVTGCGIPLLETIMDFQNRNYNGLIIADGGIRNSGDVAKALGAGAHLCMLGSMLAGTEESAGEFIYPEGEKVQPVKLYRGSASKESYISQGKTQTYISPEGESVYVPYKGKVSSILEQIEGGLRSALSYVGAKDLKEFREKVKFARVSKASYIEGTPHGKI